MPGELRKKKIVDVTFRNVSFSKTVIENCDFKECKFIECLFIDTEFNKTNFHSCEFKKCNFFKARFFQVYAKPTQFSGAIVGDNYSNIGVHLYQELRDNYLDEAQPEFMREAEYQFNRWSQKLLWVELFRPKKFSVIKLGKWFFLLIYKVTFGYGLRLRNLFATTLMSVLGLTIIARVYSESLFLGSDPVTWVKGFYFTISTMITLGAIGFTPKNELGYLFLLLNAIVGVVLLSATLNAFSKRVSR